MTDLAYRQRANELVAHGCISRERACLGKRQYLTKSEARKAANAFQKMKRHHELGSLHSYHCPFCHLHHLAKDENDDGL